MTIDLESLNLNQKKAVVWGEGPVLILAGPGSGKTRVLTFRIARLLEESSKDRFRILGITFTNKAATEMRERLEILSPDSRKRVLLTTFHSFAADLLRQHGTHISLRSDFAILAQPAERENILADVLKSQGYASGELFGDPGRLLSAIDAFLDRQVAEGQAPINVDSRIKEIADGYLKRQVELHQLDFSSLLLTAIRLLQSKPFIAQQVRRVYKYICVDEFQDTNSAQSALLKLIVPEVNPNLFIVADDDQIIYQWNGASPKRIEEIRSTFSMDVIQLPENYRCPPEVIDLANNLIAFNSDRQPDKEKLTAHKIQKDGTAVHIFDFDSFEDETQWLAETLSGISLVERSDCVVLGRTRKILELAVKKLTDNSVNAILSMRKTEFECPAVCWEQAVLRLANSRQDREFLRRTCKAFYEFEGIDISTESVVAGASISAGDYLRAWFELVIARPSLAPKTKLLMLQALPPLLDKNDFSKFMDVCHSTFCSTDGKVGVTNSPNEDLIEECTTWLGLRREIEHKLGRENVTLNSFLQELDLSSKEPRPPKNAVRCLTIHTSKGLEFKRVFLIGLAEEVLPSWGATKKGSASDEMREERRNCFVAITRAENELFMSYSRRYFGYPKAPSRFLVEMGALPDH